MRYAQTSTADRHVCLSDGRKRTTLCRTESGNHSAELSIARDMEKLCPDALFINYTNPMAMNVWAWYRASKVKVVGLCHSVQGTAWSLAVEDLKIPFEEVHYVCAGINHHAFYLRFERNGEDLYPALRQIYLEAALIGKREHIYHAAMLDPRTSAELTLDEIWSLVDDLLEAHGEMIPMGKG